MTSATTPNNEETRAVPLLAADAIDPHLALLAAGLDDARIAFEILAMLEGRLSISCTDLGLVVAMEGPQASAAGGRPIGERGCRGSA